MTDEGGLRSESFTVSQKMCHITILSTIHLKEFFIYLLGATPILERGLADDQHDLGQDFVIDPWMRTLCKNLLELFPLPLDLEPISSKVLQPAKFKIDYENLVDFVHTS